MKLPEEVIPPESYEDAAAFFEWDPKLLVGEKRLPPWERRLTAIKAPEPLLFGGAPVYTVRVNARIAAWAVSALEELHARGLWYLLNPYGGSYNFRLMKAGSRLRAHAFGAGFDFDPEHNQMGVSPSASRFGTDPRGLEAVRVLEEWGWFWGGRVARMPRKAPRATVAKLCPFVGDKRPPIRATRAAKSLTNLDGLLDCEGCGGPSGLPGGGQGTRTSNETPTPVSEEHFARGEGDAEGHLPSSSGTGFVLDRP